MSLLSIQYYTNLAHHYYCGLSPATAVGEQLDHLGRLIGCTRSDNATDAEYREKLLIKVAQNSRNETVPA